MAGEIVRELNKSLPPQYRAGPRVHFAGRMIDSFAPAEGDEAVASWTPADPTLAVETDMADFDEIEVRVYDTTRNQRLVAAVELISPNNKDRPENRSQFAAKCAALLRKGVSVVLLDIVTENKANLFAGLLNLIGQSDPSLGAEPPGTYATACRWRPRGNAWWLEVWNCEMRPGLPLPRLPVWLAEDFAIPLDLEASYEQTCRDLRIA